MSRLLPASLALLLACSAAAAQETPDAYPSRTIALVVPVAPGGPTDLVARTVAQPMAEILAKPVVIENRAGAGTSIGVAAVAKSQPDGYALLGVDISLTVTPLVVANLSYDPLKDLQPVGITARSVLTMVVSPGLEPQNATELVRFARAKPDEIKVAHAGIGTAPHLAALALMQSTSTRMLMVSYRGAALAAQDVMAGHVSMLFTAPSTTIELTRAGKLKMLGVTGTQRLAALPEVPTLHEQGIVLEGLEAGVWFGIAAPAGVPPSIIAKLNAAINKAVLDNGVREKLAKVDITAQGGTPEALGQLIERQSAIWSATLKRAGVRPE